MKCSQLGGPESCNEEFQAETFEEIANLSKRHAMEMMEDSDHKQAMDKMSEMMTDQEAMQTWMEKRKQEFEALPNQS